MRMRLAWLLNSRPDCLFAIAQIAQITESMFKSNHAEFIMKMNRSTQYATKIPVGILIPRLYLDSIRILGYSDSSFANNHDLSSNVG